MTLERAVLVRMTAPVSTSSCARPASAYCLSMNEPSVPASIDPSERYGVRRMGERSGPIRSTGTNRVEKDDGRCMRSLENIRCEVVEPMPMPTVVSSTSSGCQGSSSVGPSRDGSAASW